MLNGLFTSHLDNLQRAMDRTTQRQSMLMGNLANVNVPGYKRQDVDFHVALDGAMGMDGQKARDMRDAALQEQSDQTSLRDDGNNVDMERETLGVTETGLHFQALTDFTASYFSGLKNVIREGR